MDYVAMFQAQGGKVKVIAEGDSGVDPYAKRREWRSMTAKQQQALSFIASNPGCSIRELSIHCGITHQSAYERIGQLKRDKLITTGEKHQKRRMKVIATPL